jgi:hypothetical protein
MAPSPASHSARMLLYGHLGCQSQGVGDRGRRLVPAASLVDRPQILLIRHGPLDGRAVASFVLGAVLEDAPLFVRLLPTQSGHASPARFDQPALADLHLRHSTKMIVGAEIRGTEVQESRAAAPRDSAGFLSRGVGACSPGLVNTFWPLGVWCGSSSRVGSAFDSHRTV